MINIGDVFSFIERADAEQIGAILTGTLQAQKQLDRAVALKLCPGDRVEFRAIGLVRAVDVQAGRAMVRSAGRTFELPASMVKRSGDTPAYAVLEDAVLVNRCAEPGHSEETRLVQESANHDW